MADLTKEMGLSVCGLQSPSQLGLGACVVSNKNNTGMQMQLVA